jgi:hypothetical protein
LFNSNNKELPLPMGNENMRESKALSSSTVIENLQDKSGNCREQSTNDYCKSMSSTLIDRLSTASSAQLNQQHKQILLEKQNNSMRMRANENTFE